MYREEGIDKPAGRQENHPCLMGDGDIGRPML